MKTAREAAIEIAKEVLGIDFATPANFGALLIGPGELSDMVRGVVDAIEKGIEADRKEAASLRAPS